MLNFNNYGGNVNEWSLSVSCVSLNLNGNSSFQLNNSFVFQLGVLGCISSQTPQSWVALQVTSPLFLCFSWCKVKVMV